MHEVSIALAIIEEISERLQDHPRAAVKAVHLRIGALSAVDTSALAFAWDLATNGTAAAGSALRIEHIPLAIACDTCESTRTIPEGTLPICPVCGVPSAHIVSGRELEISAMEVEDFDAADRRRTTEHSAQEQHARA